MDVAEYVRPLNVEAKSCVPEPAASPSTAWMSPRARRNARAVSYSTSVMSNVVLSCHLPNVYVKVTALLAVVPDVTVLNPPVVLSHVHALAGTGIDPLAPAVFTLNVDRTGM